MRWTEPSDFYLDIQNAGEQLLRLRQPAVATQRQHASRRRYIW
jgi:hypothetical protein